MYGDENNDEARRRAMGLGPPAPAAVAPPPPGQGPAGSAGGPSNPRAGPPLPGGPGGGQGQVSYQSPGGVGTGHVNLNTYLGLNSGAGEQMANRVAGDIRYAAGASPGRQDPGRPGEAPPPPRPVNRAPVDPSAVAAMARAAGGGSGGLGALLQNSYGQQGGYGSGMRGFDSFLARGAGGGALDAVSAEYGGMDKFLGLAPTPGPAGPVTPADKFPVGRPGNTPMEEPPGLGRGAGPGADPRDVDQRELRRRIL